MENALKMPDFDRKCKKHPFLTGNNILGASFSYTFLSDSHQKRPHFTPLKVFFCNWEHMTPPLPLYCSNLMFGISDKPKS